VAGGRAKAIKIHPAGLARRSTADFDRRQGMAVPTFRCLPEAQSEASVGLIVASHKHHVAPLSGPSRLPWGLTGRDMGDGLYYLTEGKALEAEGVKGRTFATSTKS